MVVNTAVEYLDKLSRTAGSDRVLLKDMAEAYGKLAKVQGGGPTSSAARFRDALESQRRSVEFIVRVARADAAMAAGLATSLLDQAIIEQRLSQTAPAWSTRAKRPRFWTVLAASGKPQASVLDECARAYAYLFAIATGRGRLDEALDANRRSQTYLGRLMETDKSLRQRYRLAIAQQDEGVIYTEVGDPEKGASVLARVVQEFEELARRILAIGSTNVSSERRWRPGRSSLLDRDGQRRRCPQVSRRSRETQGPVPPSLRFRPCRWHSAYRFGDRRIGERECP
jgi:hypothetical protein